MKITAVVTLMFGLAGCLVGMTPTDGGGMDGGADVGTCAIQCTPGTSECVNNQIRLCIKEQECPGWTALQPCPLDKPYCSNERCDSVCADECSQEGERACTGNDYKVCGQHDTDPCLDWGPGASCGVGLLCLPETGECVPDCGGKPCDCEAGETQPCADVGLCQGGVRSCVDGYFGPCKWTVGPNPEICDGEDNNCNGLTDDGLWSTACDKQAGVCNGATRTCGGTSGWLDCTDQDYAAFSSDYEADEITCDGKDNDCDGKSDEPASCCKASCAGKACGADDGCGTPCQSGSCATNEICQAGVCVCDSPCFSACCGSSQVCMLQQCTACTVVGPVVLDSGDNTGTYNSLAVDVAGKIHISYKAGVTHDFDLKYATNASGSWKTFTIDATGNLGYYTSLAVDGGGKVHISYYDLTNRGLKYATNASGSFKTETVVGALVGRTSLALDSAGKVHIGFHDVITGHGYVNHATNASGSWQIDPVTYAGVMTAYTTSLALDTAGKVHISYEVYAKKGVWYSTNASGSWKETVIDPTASVSGTSLAVDGAGKVHISYRENAKHQLKYATNSSGSWNTYIIDATGDVGSSSSVVLDSKGKVHISYYDRSNQDLKYATDSSGYWKTHTIDFAGSVGAYSSIDVEGNGRVHISYWDSINYGTLKYVAPCPN